jgi:hypothetical protein
VRKGRVAVKRSLLPELRMLAAVAAIDRSSPWD